MQEPEDGRRYGTTGVVALDKQGNIAAGTSTGGMQGKMPGRVGASNQSCAVSSTGSGEYFIRLGVAREVCNLVFFRGMSLQAAADQVIHTELEALKGEGGVIAMAPDGQTAISFNTKGMFRARLAEGGALEVKIYGDER
jgi:beta-aspartyl-peptidase (threonine type)